VRSIKREGGAKGTILEEGDWFCGGRVNAQGHFADQILVNVYRVELRALIYERVIARTVVSFRPTLSRPGLPSSIELTDRLCTRLLNTPVYRIVRLIHLSIYKM